MRKLYLECYSGISGDMTVAALLDLGADSEKMENVLASLNIGEFETRISRVKKAGLDVCDFEVILKEDNHDHDMEYLHGKSDIYHCHHTHNHEGHHLHEHHHEHRHLDDILDIIHKSAMTENAKNTAENIFMVLARAEAKAHGVSINQVHFHEVGAVDSIVDIIAIAVCLDDLGIKDIIIPVLYEGTGTIRCQHGILPVPVPAVVNIVKDENLVLHIMETEGEFVTPTGAAVAAAIRTTEKLPKQFRVIKTGIGAGKRNYEKPSMLRAMIIEEICTEEDGIIKLESNIDDCTGEALG